VYQSAFELADSRFREQARSHSGLGVEPGTGTAHLSVLLAGISAVPSALAG
jgi:hypothetical protein